MRSKLVKVGTRGSKLALIQSQLVTDALKSLDPDFTFETVIIKTEGDRNFAPIPLDTVGKEWFTAEIDRALTAGDIDIAVHSLKDLPLDLDAQLALVTVLKRADPRDVLVSASGTVLKDLPIGAIVGTDSTRRKALIEYFRPDVTVQSLRGNVQTRLRKLHAGEYHAIILAAAGLARLGDIDLATEFLDPTIFIPSIGQGTIAVEYKKTRADLANLLAKIEDHDTAITSATERAFSAAIGGGCKMPIGCYTKVEHDHVVLHAMVASTESGKVRFESASGSASSGKLLAEKLATSLASSRGLHLPTS
jgi:hydroxymethylbilane synthase